MGRLGNEGALCEDSTSKMPAISMWGMRSEKT